MRVLLADDHSIVRRGLRSLLEEAGHSVVAEAADGLEAVRLSEERRPELLILDIGMPKLSGIEVAARTQKLERPPGVAMYPTCFARLGAVNGEDIMEVIGSKVAEFRQRVEKEWQGDETAAAWQKYYPQMKEQLAAVTQALVEAAAPRPGMSVLDLASGTGEPSLSLARKVAPTGRVAATDLSPGMLNALKSNAAAEGVRNIDTKVCDAEKLPFPDASFDLVTSRFGVMFFADVPGALAEIRRALKPGGSVAFLVWGAPEPGTYFGAAAMPYMRRLAVKPDPDGPGPMRFAEPGKLARVVGAAGFRDVQERTLSLPAPYRGSPEELLTSMMEIAAPFRNAAASLSEDDRRAAREEAHRHLSSLYNGTVTNVTAPIVIVTGVSR